MDKIEQYLDQVCRSIGGPRALRQHVRQELRGHLQDAVAGYKAAGLSEELALARALEEFGKPDEVRSELVATHGQRLMAVVIDKAMQWKETTMRAKWLWATWAHLALLLVIALQVMWISFATVFLVPKFNRLMYDGLTDQAILREHGMTWMISFLDDVSAVVGGYTTWLILAAAVAWGVFEWRVRSENKSFMRLSALGTAAVGLMVVAVLMSGALVIPYELSAPDLGRLTFPFALGQITTIDTSVAALEQGLAKKDWETMPEQARRASEALSRLANAAPALPSLTTWNQPPTASELRAQVTAALQCLHEAQQAIRDKDAGRLEAALKKFHESYGPVADAAGKAGKRTR
jgi:hypothetical protein